MDKWMSVKVKDQQKLCDIVIPGSHDSGVNKI